MFLLKAETTGVKMEKFFSLDYKKQKKQVILFAVLFAVIGFFIAYLPFLFGGKTFVWVPDGLLQHNTFAEYFLSNGWLKNIGSFDLSIGLGSDYLFSFAYYMICDPFILIYAVAMRIDVCFAYTAFVIAKFFAVYAVMFFYLKHKNLCPATAIIGALAYMLVGTTVYSVPRHPMFATGPIYLPLLFWGIEKVWNKEKPYWLTISTALCVFSNFYHFYICAMSCLIYAFCLYFYRQKSQNEKFCFKKFFFAFLRIGAWLFVGVMITAFLLLPTLYGMLNSSRVSSKGIKFESVLGYLKLFCNFFVVARSANYTTVGLNLFSLLLMLYFIKGSGDEYKSLLIFFSVGELVPLFGYAMNTFNYYAGRWLFAYTFVCLVCAMNALDKIIRAEENLKPNISDLLFAFLGIFISLAVVFCVGELLIKIRLHYVVALLVIVVISALLFVGAIKLSKRCKNIRFIDKLFAKNVIVPLVLVGTLVVPFTFNVNYQKTFADAKTYRNLTTVNEKYVAKENAGTMYRAEFLSSKNEIMSNHNSSLNNGYLSTFCYNSCSSNGVYEFLLQNGLNANVQTLGIGGFDGRIAYETLFNVNYYSPFAQNFVPYGFEEVEGHPNLYKNKNAYAFGTVFRNVVSREDFENTDLVERGNLLLNALVLEKESNYSYANVCEAINYAKEEKGATLSKNRIVSKKDGAIKFVLSNTRRKEIYLDLQDFYFDYNTNEQKLNTLVNGNYKHELQIQCGDFSRSIVFQEKGANGYTGMDDFLINLGYFDQESVEVELRFDAGEYKLGGLQFFGYDMQDYENSLSNASNESLLLKSVDRITRETEGEIALESDGYLFLSIPYSSGWTATVDGQKAEIIKANYGFMALKLSAGTHIVRLTYKTPFLNVGYVISAVGCAVLACRICYDVVMKKRKKRPSV